MDESKISRRPTIRLPSELLTRFQLTEAQQKEHFKGYLYEDFQKAATSTKGKGMSVMKDEYDDSDADQSFKKLTKRLTTEK